MFLTYAYLDRYLKYNTQRLYIYPPAKLGKQIFGLLLTAAAPLQRLAYAFPLDAAVNDLSPQLPTTWCTSNVVPFIGSCFSPVFYRHLGCVGVPVGGSVQDETGLLVPSRQWTSDEALEYLLSGGSKLPPP